jgi:hypothetical protein
VEAVAKQLLLPIQKMVLAPLLGLQAGMDMN